MCCSDWSVSSHEFGADISVQASGPDVNITLHTGRSKRRLAGRLSLATRFSRDSALSTPYVARRIGTMSPSSSLGLLGPHLAVRLNEPGGLSDGPSVVALP